MLPPLLQPGGDVVALVKPQFEAGREEVGKGGIVRDEGVHKRVVDEVTAAAQALGLQRTGVDGIADHRHGRQPRVPAPSAPAVTRCTISRVGLVAKQRVEAAAGVLARAGRRGSKRAASAPVFETETATWRAPSAGRTTTSQGGSAERVRH